MQDSVARSRGARSGGTDFRIYVAGLLTLTEPGPAAAGIVVTDPTGRTVAHRAHYLGYSTREEALARALLAAIQFAIANSYDYPTFMVEDASLLNKLNAGAEPADDSAPALAACRMHLAEISEYSLQIVSPSANMARSVALAPLIEWLPERTRRAEKLVVRKVSDGNYEVSSETRPGVVYRVTLPAAGEAGSFGCECADFLYRGIPCKHLLVVARETGDLERLFYPGSDPTVFPSGPESLHTA